jgi:hypothetical protein
LWSEGCRWDERKIEGHFFVLAAYERSRIFCSFRFRSWSRLHSLISTWHARHVFWQPISFFWYIFLYVFEVLSFEVHIQQTTKQIFIHCPAHPPTKKNMSALLDLLSKHLELVGLISEYRLLYAQFQKSEMAKSVDKDTMNKIALHIDIIDSTRFIFRNPQPRLEY